MPNWCENDLYLDGPPAKLAEALDLIGEVFDFDKLIPYPEKFKQMDAEAAAFGWSNKDGTAEERAALCEAYKAKWGTESDGFNSGGYEWCTSNWGTKWNCCKVTTFEHPRRGQCLSFSTAWSPPLPVIEALANKFPELRIELEYFEGGAAYYGGVQYEPADEVDDGEERSRSWQGAYAGSRGG